MSTLLAHLLAHPDFRPARLPSLYSDFRHLRTNNPSGFTANTAAWTAALGSAARAGILTDTLALRTGEALVAGLATREWGRPLGLGCVVAEAVARADWFPLKTFMERAESVYYRAWIDPWGLLSWGLETAGLKGRGAAEGVEKGAQFVVLKNVEESAQQLLSQISLLPPGPIPRLFTLPLLVSSHPNPLTSAPYTPTDLRILLKFLTRDLRAAAVSGDTIKFSEPGRDPTPISDHDHSIARLRSSIADLHSQTADLAARIEARTGKARDALAAQNRILALAALRGRKMEEAVLERRVAALAQLEEVLERIESAGGNVEMVALMKRCGKVLRALNREVGSVQAVEEAVDGVRGEMDEVEEVTRVLGGVALEDGEVEEEMEEMLAEEERRREEEREKRVMEELGRLSLEEEKGKKGKKEEEEEDKKEEKVAVPAS